MECMDSLVCLVYSLEDVGNKVIDREFAAQVLVDQFRHIRSTLEPTESSTLPNAPGNELKRASRNLVTRCSHSNHARGTPSTMSAFQSCAHDFSVTSAVKSVVTSPFCEGACNVTLHGHIQGGAVHAISGTQCNRIIELFFVNIHGDDATCTSNLGTLNDCQTNSSQAKNSHGGIRLNLAGIQDRTESSGHSTTKETNLLQWSRDIDFSTRDFSQHSVLCHR
mmetsp:Transcript_8054/g.15363  ORF Transcript_8054/g.15363 Transcript_8054/m.15363 type:complete len:222 (+) Transcript_8054:90-755(+)